MSADPVPQSIVLPWPPSVNHYYTVARGRKILGAKGREYREEIAAQAKRELWPVFSPVYGLIVDIEAWMPDRRKRDLDNVLKATLDALTHAQLWLDDSQVVDLRIHKAPALGGMLKITVREAQ
jgi:crossover junction endodeoxyribonuclease RusA